MHYSHFENQDHVQVKCKDGIQLSVRPGFINGLLHIQGFTDLQRGVRREHGVLRLTFAFAAVSGDIFRYLALLSPDALWPGPDAPATGASGPFKKHVTLQAGAGSFMHRVIEYDGDRKIEMPSEDVGATLLLREIDSGLAVRLEVKSRANDEPPDHDGIAVDYSIPLARLLWHPAPPFVDHRIIFEDDGSCDVERIGALGDSGVPSELSPSSVSCSKPTS